MMRLYILQLLVSGTNPEYFGYGILLTFFFVAVFLVQLFMSYNKGAAGQFYHNKIRQRTPITREDP